jgi:hypothetical protein
LREQDPRVDDPEATVIILETLFDIRRAVYDLHDLFFDDEEEEKEDS